jgi:hypothetical protein
MDVIALLLSVLAIGLIGPGLTYFYFQVKGLRLAAATQDESLAVLETNLAATRDGLKAAMPKISEDRLITIERKLAALQLGRST